MGTSLEEFERNNLDAGREWKRRRWKISSRKRNASCVARIKWNKLGTKGSNGGVTKMSRPFG